MIVYNVTCNMDKPLAPTWLNWMFQEHIPEVMQSGCFLECKVLKLLTEAEDNQGVNYAIQYTASSMEEYERYKQNFAPALQQKTKDKFGDQVLAFRSLLEVIN
ncbi:MAG: DUF4286 family protein [Flavobacterium stagni]|jgi:hypothetical protein